MIHLSVSKNVKKILIENSLNQYDNEKLLAELDNSSGFTTIEITFLNIKTLPEEIFKALHRIKSRIKITTTQRTLWHYLTKLGINNQYKSNTDVTHVIKEPIQAIVIGGSAGSIEKMLPIIKAIPYLDISIFVVVHVLPDKKSHLVQVLQNVTGYKVLEATNNTKIENGRLYVAAPNFHMVISGNYIYLDDSKEVQYSRPSIDMTFKSLSYQYRTSLLAILLCGYGRDGSGSLKDLKLNGSEVIIEDTKECTAKAMPLNAIKTLYYDKILDVEQIRSYVKSALTVNIDIKDEMEFFLENIYVVYGYDFRNYDRNSLVRRIKLIMRQNGIDNFKKFERLVFDDIKFFDKLLRAFSINVTNFFRNPDVFKSVKKNIIPYIESFPSIRIWCAGCSRGDEAYSLAMILDEIGLLDKSQIYATDFNQTILNEAQNALYPLNELDEARENYMQSGGERNFSDWFENYDGFAQVRQDIRKKVIFFQHNLAIDSSINEFHLIFCRNVLIYFDKKLQQKVFHLIDESLFRNAFLVLGQSEVTPKEFNYKNLGDKKHKIYKKGAL